MAEAVKAFAAKVTTSKTNERRKILSNLLPHISKSGKPFRFSLPSIINALHDL